MGYRLIIACMTALQAAAAGAETVTAAVASNFGAPMERLAQQFEQATGHEVELAFGASGKFVAQVSQGAPFDVFLSADQAKPAALLEKELAVPGSRFTYAVGALALWSPEPDAVAGSGRLERGAFNKLAIANPKLAPYGVAAVQVLEAMGIYQEVAPKLVRGENIAQTYQFVATGNAQLGFVALSQVMENGELKSGSAWIPPLHAYEPIAQDAVLLQHGADNPAARALLDYLRSDSARAIIERFGYRTGSAD